MIARGVTLEDLQTAADAAEVVLYNVGPNPRGRGISFMLRPGPDTPEHRRRRGHRGRRLWAVTWDTHWDFFVALFDRVPDARVRSALATYNGRASFYATAPGTLNRGWFQ